jgi:tetratricopeptide (TPR) repeat protein
VLVNDTPPVDVDGDDTAAQIAAARASAHEAATELLALPWELLHDGRSWLFQGKNAVRVRRRLPNRLDLDEHTTGLPIRILLVSPRPDKADQGGTTGYIDHRASALPLVDAVESLGELARLTVLQPPTYAALEAALQEGDEGKPFDVVHFDGHGVYDRKLGLGGLCFEQPQDDPGRGDRILDFVDAARLAGLVRDQRIPLVFLEACQTALAETDPTASVAGRLLQEGVASVVAMTHSVLVETSRRFVKAFYRELAVGARVGTAMLAGQRALFDDPRRGKILGAGELELHDWFVPVLYQEELDPQPITRLPSRDVQQLAEQTRTLRLGQLPDPPDHHFQGRSRELLALERHLHQAQWAVVRGTGGQGKTTLAVELARWLVRTDRAQRAVFVSLEHHRDPRAVLDTIGRQLVPGYSVSPYPTLDAARQPVVRALRDQPVVLVVDNCESVLPDPALTDTALTAPDEPENGGDTPAADDVVDTSAVIFELCRQLMAADPSTRMVFTTREHLPRPFARTDHEWELGALHRDDAVELVRQVMTQNDWTPPTTDPGATPQEITDLVDAVHCHPRALVLLAREITERGVRVTTADLRTLMADLDRKHPGQRENSLYASVALSLRRLSPDARRNVQALACCHGGVHLAVLAILTELDINNTRRLARELIGLGLAEDMGDGHLRLDPGLAPYLLAQQNLAETDTLETRWADAMVEFLYYLRQERTQNAQYAARLTVLELPNLLSLLDSVAVHQSAEQVVNVAATIEGLLRYLGQPRAFAHAVRIRERAAEQLTGWSRARHQAGSAEIDRLWRQGELPNALAAAERLLDQHLAATETTYPGADYDTAMTYAQLGRVLQSGGAAQAALHPFHEAHRRFQQLPDSDNSAAGMAAKMLGEIGSCLEVLGRLDEAVEAHQAAIDRLTRLGERRDTAVAESRLAAVRLQQSHYQEALDIYGRVRATFEALGEPRSVGTALHQIGIVYQMADEFDAAEDAYRQSLAISVREADLLGQADTLNQLGNLYAAQGRYEESVTFLQQATKIYTESEERAREGAARGNLAIRLLRLRRYEEARQELQRAIACKQNYGHAAQPWLVWTTLTKLERETGNLKAARAARQQAIDTYLAYRRDGGHSQSDLYEYYTDTPLAINRDETEDLGQALDQLLESEIPVRLSASIRALQVILAGRRDPTLTDDLDIDPIDAAELLLLLEALDQQGSAATPD